jgi:hypothetical protein
MPTNIPVQVRFPADELSALDNYRRAQRNSPSRPQAIRELARADLGADDRRREVDHHVEGRTGRDAGFRIHEPRGQAFHRHRPQGVTPEQAWAVLQQHVTGAGSHRDAGPADWGAIPADEGPAKWGAIP